MKSKKTLFFYLLLLLIKSVCTSTAVMCSADSDCKNSYHCGGKCRSLFKKPSLPYLELEENENIKRNTCRDMNCSIFHKELPHLFRSICFNFGFTGEVWVGLSSKWEGLVEIEKLLGCLYSNR